MNRLNSILALGLILFIYLLGGNHNLLAQSFQNDLTATFFNEEVIYHKGEILSNVLKVKNLTNKDLVIKIKVFTPNKWRSVYRKKKMIVIPPNDSSYVPVRIVPSGKIIGNTKFFINAIIYSEDDNQIGNASFYVGTLKNVNWILTIDPDNRIYFKNNEVTAKFSVNTFNTGNYDQDILLDVKTAKKQVHLSDTNGVAIDNPIYNLKLEPGEDTTLHYIARVEEGTRNFKTVSLDNHKPNIETTERNYTIFVNSVEPRVSSDNAVKKGQKLNLIKLPNEKRVSLYESGSIPLTINGYVQNILGKSSFMSLILNGRKEFEDNSFLYYSTNLNYTTNYFNRKLLNNLAWAIGYLNQKYAVQIGQINGGNGILASGQGITGTYKINSKNEVGAAFVRSPNIFSNYARESIGFTHEYTSEAGFRFRTSFTHSYNKRAKSYNDLLSFRSAFKIIGSHKIGLFTSFSKSNPAPLKSVAFTNPGYLVGLNYSNIFLEKKLHVNLSGRYNPKEYGVGNTERLAGNMRAYYKANAGWQTYFSSSYLNTKRTYFINSKVNNQDSVVNHESLNFSNQINFSSSSNKTGVQPGLFYNVLGEPGILIHSRGINMRFTKSNLSNNTLFSTHINLGYNDPVSHREIADYFIFQFSSLLRIRTLSFNARYMYGPNSAGAFYKLIEDNYNPQSLRLSLQHQYLFKNSHFILQSSGSYSYNNRFAGSNFGLYPELYYFTSSGWRFSLNANYSISTSNFERGGDIYSQTSANQQEENKRSVNQGLTIGLSFRKDIGIPNPLAKEKSMNVELISFYDLNGNSKWEKDEPTLENIVIKIGENHLISNKKGTALIKNIKAGSYVFYVFSLEKLDGWFPNIPDTLVLDVPGNRYIPFVKGVKIRGNVFIEKEEMSADYDKAFDLSNIKITATGKDKGFSTLTNFDGEFELYVPNGNYNLTLDKKILTERYRLLRNDIEMILSKDLENVYTSFQIIERKRVVKVKKFKQD